MPTNRALPLTLTRSLSLRGPRRRARLRPPCVRAQVRSRVVGHGARRSRRFDVRIPAVLGSSGPPSTFGSQNGEDAARRSSRWAMMSAETQDGGRTAAPAFGASVLEHRFGIAVRWVSGEKAPVNRTQSSRSAPADAAGEPAAVRHNASPDSLKAVFPRPRPLEDRVRDARPNCPP
jgi:hypothetical protein